MFTKFHQIRQYFIKFSTRYYFFNLVETQYVPANAQSRVNACAAIRYRWSVKIHSFWRHLACFQNRMPRTRPDFVLMLGFYHNFSIASLKNISRKIFATLSQTQWFLLLSINFIRITERGWAIHLLPTRQSLCPYVTTNNGIFTRIFQWQTRFHRAVAPTNPGPNPI